MHNQYVDRSMKLKELTDFQAQKMMFEKKVNENSVRASRKER